MSLIADIVVSSAAAAFAHFGLTVDVPDREPPKAERTVARTQVKKPQPVADKAEPAAIKAEDCPDPPAAEIHRI